MFGLRVTGQMYLYGYKDTGFLGEYSWTIPDISSRKISTDKKYSREPIAMVYMQCPKPLFSLCIHTNSQSEVKLRRM